MWPDADQRAFEPFFTIKDMCARRDDGRHDVRRFIARYVIAVTSGRATLGINFRELKFTLICNYTHKLLFLT